MDRKIFIIFYFPFFAFIAPIGSILLGYEFEYKIDLLKAKEAPCKKTCNPCTPPCPTGQVGPTGPKGEKGERGKRGERGRMGLMGPTGPTGNGGGSSNCNDVCTLGLQITFNGPDGALPPPGTTETFGPTTPTNLSVVLSAWDTSSNPQTINNLSQGVGVFEAVSGQIDDTHFIQIDMSNILNDSQCFPINLSITCGKSDNTSKQFELFSSSTSGLLGTSMGGPININANSTASTTLTINGSNTLPRYLNVISTTNFFPIYLSAITITKCDDGLFQPLPALTLIVPSQFNTTQVVGVFYGQSAYFKQTGEMLRWDGSAWVF